MLEGESIRTYRDLRAWQRAMDFCQAVYEACTNMPSDERYALVQQLHKSGVSVPSNIAEGWGRGPSADYLRFLKVARGSLFEAETQLLLSVRVGLLGAEVVDPVLEVSADAGRVLQALISAVESNLRRLER